MCETIAGALKMRNLLLAVCIVTVFCGVNARIADAMGGRLKRPGIAIPTGDSTAAAMQKVFASRDKQFAGGHFINSHTVLNFNGGTKTINNMLDELSKIDGVVVRIQLANGPDSVAIPFGTKGEQPKECACSVDHNAWADAHEVTFTIYVGGEVKLEELNLPPIRGRGTAK
jgi:hypothetical protein